MWQQLTTSAQQLPMFCLEQEPANDDCRVTTPVKTSPRCQGSSSAPLSGTSAPQVLLAGHCVGQTQQQGTTVLQPCSQHPC
jgi:hypothetical protein